MGACKGLRGGYVENSSTRKPDDYVLSTGHTYSVRWFQEKVFKEVGINLAWRGDGLEEIGIDSSTGKSIVHIDPEYFRPTEVELLIGDSIRRRKNLVGNQN